MRRFPNTEIHRTPPTEPRRGASRHATGLGSQPTALSAPRLSRHPGYATAPGAPRSFPSTRRRYFQYRSVVQEDRPPWIRAIRRLTLTEPERIRSETQILVSSNGVSPVSCYLLSGRIRADDRWSPGLPT